jgi:2-amino-4-hydroxy-6-hydroxymethyldihydropteridine diphosphokinase
VSSVPVRAVIALGSNLGDRRSALAFATDRLGSLLQNPVLSDIIETEPLGEGLADQPLFLNAVVVGDTTLTARALLDALQSIESDFGRTRPFPGAARTLDLDLVLFGDAVLNQPGLEIPRARATGRDRAGHAGSGHRPEGH